MRNYIKLFVVSGHYDDGFGGTVIFTNFFESEKQVADFFASVNLLNPVWNTFQHVWFLMNKRNVVNQLNQAHNGAEFSPGFFIPENGFTIYTPNGEWFLSNGGLNKYFHRALQDPIR